MKCSYLLELQVRQPVKKNVALEANGFWALDLHLSVHLNTEVTELGNSEQL